MAFPERAGIVRIVGHRYSKEALTVSGGRNGRAALLPARKPVSVAEEDVVKAGAYSCRTWRHRRP
jgi:hypothetical protein